MPFVKPPFKQIGCALPPGPLGRHVSKMIGAKQVDVWISDIAEEILKEQYVKEGRSGLANATKEREAEQLKIIASCKYKYHHAPIVYTLWDGARIKVGTTTHFKTRMPAFQKETKRRLNILSIMFGNEEVEDSHKNRLTKYSIIGEWYQPHWEVIKSVTWIGELGVFIEWPLDELVSKASKGR